MLTLDQATFYHTSFTSWCLIEEILSKSSVNPNPVQKVLNKSFQNLVASISFLAAAYLGNSNKILGAALGATFLIVATPAISSIMQWHPPTNKRVKKIVLTIDKYLNIIVKIINVATATLLVQISFGTSASNMTLFYLSNLTKNALTPPTILVLQPAPIIVMQQPNLANANAAAA